MDQGKPDPQSWMDALSWQYGRSQEQPSLQSKQARRQDQSSQQDVPRQAQSSQESSQRDAQRPDPKTWNDALAWQYDLSRKPIQPGQSPRQEQSSQQGGPSSHSQPKPQSLHNDQPQRYSQPSQQGHTRHVQSSQEGQQSKPDPKSWMDALSWQYGRSPQQPPPQHDQPSQHGPRTVTSSSPSYGQHEQHVQSPPYGRPATYGCDNRSTQYSQKDKQSAQYGQRNQDGQHPEYGQPAQYAQRTDSNQLPAQCYQIRLYEPGQQQDCPPPVIKAPTCRTRNPDDFKVRGAMIPGVLMVIISLINVVNLAILLCIYTRIEDTATVEMTLALLFYGIVGVLGIIGAIWSDKRIVIGIIVVATITLVIAGYQICLNASIIYSHDSTRRQYGWPRTYHFQSPAMIIPLANEVVGWFSFILSITLIVLASKVVCRTCFWCYTWQPRPTINQGQGEAVIRTLNTGQRVDELTSPPFSGQPGSFVYTSSSQTKLLDPDDIDAVLRVTSF